jgi:hypothetical protein
MVSRTYTVGLIGLVIGIFIGQLSANYFPWERRNQLYDVVDDGVSASSEWNRVRTAAWGCDLKSDQFAPILSAALIGDVKAIKTLGELIYSECPDDLNAFSIFQVATLAFSPTDAQSGAAAFFLSIRLDAVASLARQTNLATVLESGELRILDYVRAYMLIVSLEKGRCASGTELISVLAALGIMSRPLESSILEKSTVCASEGQQRGHP